MVTNLCGLRTKILFQIDANVFVVGKKEDRIKIKREREEIEKYKIYLTSRDDRNMLAVSELKSGVGEPEHCLE